MIPTQFRARGPPPWPHLPFTFSHTQLLQNRVDNMEFLPLIFSVGMDCGDIPTVRVAMIYHYILATKLETLLEERQTNIERYNREHEFPKVDAEDDSDPWDWDEIYNEVTGPLGSQITRWITADREAGADNVPHVDDIDGREEVCLANAIISTAEPVLTELARLGRQDVESLARHDPDSSACAQFQSSVETKKGRRWFAKDKPPQMVSFAEGRDLTVFTRLMHREDDQVKEALDESKIRIQPTAGRDRNPWLNLGLDYNRICLLAIRLREIVFEDVREELEINEALDGFVDLAVLGRLAKIDFFGVAEAVYYGFTPESLVTTKNTLVRFA